MSLRKTVSDRLLDAELLAKDKEERHKALSIIKLERGRRAREIEDILEAKRLEEEIKEW